MSFETWLAGAEPLSITKFPQWSLLAYWDTSEARYSWKLPLWIDPPVGDPPRSRSGRSLYIAPMEISRDTEAGWGQLEPRLGDFCWYGHFSNLTVRTIDSPRHKERVRANGMDLRKNTVTIAAARDFGFSATQARLGCCESGACYAGGDPTLPGTFHGSTALTPRLLPCRYFGLRYVKAY